MRAIDLAVYADALAGEAAAVTARGERSRARLRQAAIEREARSALGAEAVARLQARGLLRPFDLGGVREEIAELDADLAALVALQAWVEERLADEQDGVRPGGRAGRGGPARPGGYASSRGDSATRRPPSSS